MRTRRAAAAVTPSVPGLGPLFPSAEEIADADVRSPAEKLLDGLNDAQREVVLHEAGPLACFAGAGCHRAGQLLLKYDGTWVAVEDVAVGDLLMGPDSEPRSVLRLIRGRGKMVEVAPVKGHPFVVNNDHVLTLVESVSGEVRDVVVRDVANLPKRKQWKLFRVGVDFRGTGDALPIEPYFLGVLLGDGSMSAGATVGVSKPDPEILAEVTRQAVLWGLTVRSYGAGTTEVTHFLSSGSPKGKPCKGRNPLLVALDALGLRGPSEDRFVPFCYLRASREIRLQVLAGLLDTDGSCALGGYDFISKSRKLSRDVVDLARGLGLAAYITKCRKGCQTGAVGTYWRVSVSGDCSVVPCRLPRKRAAERRQKKNVLRTGFVCRPLGEEPYFGFTLDGDGRYLLADYTVTHNSGKTKCLVHRVARLVSAGGVEPTRIFCVTFSNAGSREMNERLKKLGVPATVQTWHAFCLRVLKQEQTREGSWTVEGEPGSKLNAKLFLKKAIGYQHENWVGADLSAIRSFIGICKANLWAPEDPETTEEARRRFKHNGSRAVRVYAISESLVEEAGFLLFDNMLTYVARLFRDHEDVRASWAAKFDHVMQDEAQDASVAQVTLARLLAKDHRNYMIVGDPSQCHPPGVMIETTREVQVPIESLRDGDVVRGWNRNAQKMVGERRVRVGKRDYNGWLYTMKSGTFGERSVPMTANHQVLARWTDRKCGALVTYLMWRSDLGFRVGWCKLFAKSGENDYGFHLAQRARIEKAERVWILGVHATRTAASVYESIVAAKYGIPTATFEPVDNAEHQTAAAIKQIFDAVRDGRLTDEIDDSNYARGVDALRDHKREFDLPLYPWVGRTRETVERQGRMTYFEVYACNLLPSLMSVPLPDAQNMWRPITAIEHRGYAGPVYSLDVEGDHSYAANGVVVLNCIYGFRGSNPRYLTEFPGQWNSKVVTLATNYRSCRRVVAVANEVIRDAPYKLPEDMVAARDLDGKVEIVAANTLDDEAEELVAFVKKHAASGNAISDVCVLYRTNAQSRALEQAFLGAKIPHVIIGNVNFYERKEVKDLLAYLRLAAGADREGDAVKRCINAPFRFLGNRFVEKVQDARDADPNASWQDCVLSASQAERIQDRQRRSALDWVDLINELRRLIDEGVPKDVATLDGNEPEKRTANAHDVLSRVVSKTRYVEWLEKEEGEESIDSSHAANVREMLRVSAEFPTVADFLAFVDKQVAESRKNKQGSKASESVTLMSVHRSKGLEWPVVWIVGCVDGVLPHAKGDPDEEQRLFYVAATRARDHLVCSFIREMATRAGVRTVERSEYLNCFDRNPGSGADESGEHVLATDEAAIEDAYGSSFAEPPMPEQVVTRVEDPETGAVGMVHGDVAPSPEAVAAFQGIVRAAGEFLAEAAKAERESTPGTLDWLGDGACASCGKRFADCGC